MSQTVVVLAYLEAKTKQRPGAEAPFRDVLFVGLKPPLPPKDIRSFAPFVKATADSSLRSE